MISPHGQRGREAPLLMEVDMKRNERILLEGYYIKKITSNNFEVMKRFSGNVIGNYTDLDDAKDAILDRYV